MELNVFYEANWTQLAELELQQFQDEILRQLFAIDDVDFGRPTRDSHYGGGEDSFENFPAALLYSLTLITTIGMACNKTMDFITFYFPPLRHHILPNMDTYRDYYYHYLYAYIQKSL